MEWKRRAAVEETCERYDDVQEVRPAAEEAGLMHLDVALSERVDDDADSSCGRPQTYESTLAIDNTVVEKIVAITCRSVDGVLQMKGNLISSIQEGFGGTDIKKGVTVEMVGDNACIVNVSIIMEYGKSAPKIFRELHERISEKITVMTGLRVNAVNVRITNVMTREEAEGGRKREKGEGESKVSAN